MSTSATRYDVFLSHNSADYFAAVELERRLASAGMRPWFAASQLIPGRPWQEAMEAALAQSETVAVIIGPQGMGPWHNEQMRVAIDDAVRHGKNVIPVLLPGADPERIDPFLKRRTWVDFCSGLENEAAFQLLLAGIRGEAPFEAGDLFGLAWARRKDFYRQIPYPTNFVPRPEIQAAVRQALLADTAALALTSAIKMDALHGMGGIGKSVMARALCDDPEVQATFPDGILWTTMGRTPDLIPRLREWIDALGGTVSEIAPTVDRLKAVLADLLRERACLLIVDDVWRKAHAEAFRMGGRRCRLLLTTRDAALADDLGAALHVVPVMTEVEAVELLEVWAKGGLQGAAPDVKGKIVRQLGWLPLAIRLAGAQLKWQESGQWLASFDVRKLQVRRVEDVHDSLEATFGLSLDDLAPADRPLYAALAIFKKDEPLVVAGIVRLWSALDGRDGDETRDLLDDLAARALVEHSHVDGDAINIHDLLRDFMAAELGDAGRIAAHRALLDAYRATQEGDGWHGARDDGYLFDHLAYHLDSIADHDSGSMEEFRQLFARQDWMQARVARSRYVYDGYLADLETATQRVHQAVHHGISEGWKETELTVCVRHALIQTSVNTLAAGLDPTLVVRAVETGLWPVERALSWGRLIPNAERRMIIPAAMLGIDGLSAECRQLAQQDALMAVLALNKQTGRNTALANLVPRLTHEFIPQALEATLALDDAFDRLNVLAALAPQLDDELLQGILESVTQSGDAWYSAKALAVLGPRLTGELLAEALEAALGFNDERYRAEGLISLASQLTGELLAKALEAVLRFGDERHRAEELIVLAPQLPDELLAKALGVALGIIDEWRRAEVLVALAPRLTAELASGALMAAVALTEERCCRSVIAALAPQLTEESVRQLLAVTSETDQEQHHERVWTILASQLMGQTKHMVLRQLMVTALGIDDDRERSQALITLVPQLTDDFLQDVLAASLTITHEGWQAEILAALAPRLPSSLLQEAMTVVQDMEDHGWRAMALAALGKRLTGGLVGEGLAAAQALDDECWRSEVLVALSPRLSGEMICEGLTAAQAIGDERWRSEILVALAPKLTDELVREGLTAAQAIGDERWRSEILVALVPKLTDELVREGLTAAQAIDDERWRAQALVAFAARESTVELVQELLVSVQRINDRGLRLRVIGALSPTLAGDLAVEGLAVAQGIADDLLRSHSISSEPQTMGTWHREPRAVVHEIGDGQILAETFAILAGKVAGKTRSMALRAALVVALNIPSVADRTQVLDSLAPQLNDESMWLGLAVELDYSARILVTAVPALAPKLAEHILETALREAFAAADSIPDDTARAEAFEVLISVSTRTMVQDRLKSVLTIQDEHAYVRALVTLVPNLEGEIHDRMLRHGLTVALAANSHKVEPALVAALASQCTRTLFRAELRRAQARWDTTARASILTNLARQLVGTAKDIVLREALPAVLAIVDQEVRIEAFETLAPHLEGELVQEALEAAMMMCDDEADSRPRALVALVPHLTDESAQKAFAAVLTTGHDLYLAEFLEALAPELSDELVHTGLEATLAMVDDWSRERALVALAPKLTAGLAHTAFSSALTIRNDMRRAQVLAAIAPQLSGEQREAAVQLGIAAALASKSSAIRAQTLASFAVQLNGATQNEVLRILLEDIQSNARPFGGYYCAEGLVAVAPLLTEDLVREGLRAALKIGLDSYRWEPLIALAPQFTGDLAHEVFEAVLTTHDNRMKARLLATLAGQLTGEDRDTALREGLTEALNTLDDQALAILAPRLTEELVRTALLAQANCIGWRLPQASAALVLHLEGQLREIALQWTLVAAETIHNDQVRASVLIVLAQQLPKPLRKAARRQALVAAQTIQSSQHRAHALVEIMPLLTRRDRMVVLRDGLAAATDIAHEKSRAEALASFLPYIPNPTSCLSPIRHAMAEHLWRIHDQERKEVLEFIAEKGLFAPPILSRASLTSIAHDMVEICQEWEWL